LGAARLGLALAVTGGFDVQNYGVMNEPINCCHGHGVVIKYLIPTCKWLV